MITIGSGSSRPASSIPIPGTSHATASSAGASVTAAKAHPAATATSAPAAAVRAPRSAGRGRNARLTAAIGRCRGPRAGRARLRLVSWSSRTGACFSSMTSASSSCRGKPVGRGATRGRPCCGSPPRASTAGSRRRTEPPYLSECLTTQGPATCRHAAGLTVRAQKTARRS